MSSRATIWTSLSTFLSGRRMKLSNHVRSARNGKNRLRQSWRHRSTSVSTRFSEDPLINCTRSQPRTRLTMRLFSHSHRRASRFSLRLKAKNRLIASTWSKMPTSCYWSSRSTRWSLKTRIWGSKSSSFSSRKPQVGNTHLKARRKLRVIDTLMTRHISCSRSMSRRWTKYPQLPWRQKSRRIRRWKSRKTNWHASWTKQIGTMSFWCR